VSLSNYAISDDLAWHWKTSPCWKSLRLPFFHTVVQQLTRLRLTQRIARSLWESWASTCFRLCRRTIAQTWNLFIPPHDVFRVRVALFYHDMQWIINSSYKATGTHRTTFQLTMVLRLQFVMVMQIHYCWRTCKHFRFYWDLSLQFNATDTRSSAIGEGPRDALSQLRSCQLFHKCKKKHMKKKLVIGKWLS